MEDLHPKEKTDHILCAVSKLSTIFLKNNVNNLKQIVWEIKKCD